MQKGIKGVLLGYTWVDRIFRDIQGIQYYWGKHVHRIHKGVYY